MKKTYVGMMLLCLLLLLGCAGEKKAGEDKGENADIIVGVEEKNAPYYSVDEKGEESGLYVDLMEELAAKGGFTYSFCPMTISGFRGSAGQECDVFLGNMEMERGSMAKYAQMEPFFQTALCLMVKKGSAIKEKSDLRGVSIAATAGAGEENFAEYLASKYGADSILFVNEKSCYEDFAAGYSEGLVVEDILAQKKKKKDKNFRIMITSKKYKSSHTFTARSASGIPKLLSEGMKRMKEDGSLEVLIQKYKDSFSQI